MGPHAVTEEDGRHGRQSVQGLGDGQYHLVDRLQGRLPHPAAMAWQFHTANLDAGELRRPVPERSGVAAGERETNEPRHVAGGWPS